MLRIVIRVLGVVVLVVLIAAAGLFAVSRGNLAEPAARLLSHEIGRKVAIGHLRLRLGRVTNVDLSDVTVANTASGSRPAMVTVGHLNANVLLSSVLSGSLVIPSISIERANLYLERGSDNRPNWRFKTETAGLTEKEPSRVELPTLQNSRFRDVEIDFRTSAGELLKTVITDGSVTTTGSDKPVSLHADGFYNDAPFALSADLSSFEALHRAAAPFPARIAIKSGPTTLNFDGAFTAPLDVDGADGKLEVDTTSLPDLAKIVGVGDAPEISLQISGGFVRNGDLWRWSDSLGSVAGQSFTGALELDEGARGQPDAVKLDATFDSLDTNAIVKPPTSSAQSSQSASLMMDPSPGVLLDMKVGAKHFVYRTISADDFAIKAKTGPGTLAIDDFAASIAGGMANSKISIVNQDDKAVIDFEGALVGVDADKTGILLGWGPLPVDGPVNSHVIGRMIGADITEARRTNRIFAVVAMDGGAIDRQVVRMAGTDIRLLFGAADRVRKLYCLLAVANLRDGKGTIGPVRIKSSAGAIAGSGSYDSVRDVVDLVIGAQSKSWFALDVPIRISGPITNFSVRPAFGASRTLNEIALPDDLPQALRDIATGNQYLRR